MLCLMDIVYFSYLDSHVQNVDLLNLFMHAVVFYNSILHRSLKQCAFGKYLVKFLTFET